MSDNATVLLRHIEVLERGGDQHPDHLYLDGRSGGQVLTASDPGLIFRVRDSGLVSRLNVDDSGDALFEMLSTTQGFRPPVMTEAQRDAIGTPAAGLVVFNSDDGEINQYDGTGWSIPGVSVTTLQDGYDNDPLIPQILVNNVPNPLAVRASVAGNVFIVEDVGGQNIFQVSANPDAVAVQGSVTVDDPFLNAAAVQSIVMSDTFTTGAPFIGGGILSDGTITYDNSFFIWALLQESKAYEAAVGPGFAAFTLFNALASIRNSGNFDLVQALILNAGVTHQRVTSGTSIAAQNIGLSFAGGLRTTVSGAVMNLTNGMEAVSFAPNFGTVAGSSIGFGTLIGLHAKNPAPGLFQPSAGTETMTAYHGLLVDAIPFGGNVLKTALQSSIAPASNAYFVRNLGGAQSNFGGGNLLNCGVVQNLGDGIGFSSSWGAAGGDVTGYWDGSRWVLNPGIGDDFRITQGVGFTSFDGGAAVHELRQDFEGFNLGPGSRGNQFINTAMPAQSTGVAGEWATVNLSYAGNVTFDAAMSGVYSWNIGTLAFALGTGSVAGPIATLNVGPMVTSGVGSAETMGLRANGRTQFRGHRQMVPVNPANITTNQTAYNGGLTATQSNSQRPWWRTTNDAAVIIRGINSSGVQDGDTVDWTNIGGNALTFTNNDGAAAAADRIRLGAFSGTLGVDETITLRYDGATAIWRVVGM